MTGAACVDVDPEVFFGPGDSPIEGPVLPWEQKALEVCASCPVTEPCLDAALRFPGTAQWGVVGGMTASQRRKTLAVRHAATRVARAKARVAVRAPESVSDGAGARGQREAGYETDSAARDAVLAVAR